MERYSNQAITHWNSLFLTITLVKDERSIHIQLHSVFFIIITKQTKPISKEKSNQTKPINYMSNQTKPNQTNAKHRDLQKHRRWLLWWWWLWLLCPLPWLWRRWISSSIISWTCLNLSTRQGIVIGPACLKPYSSSASFKSLKNRGWFKNINGTMNLCRPSVSPSWPTMIATQPLGTWWWLWWWSMWRWGKWNLNTICLCTCSSKPIKEIESLLPKHLSRNTKIDWKTINDGEEQLVLKDGDRKGPRIDGRRDSEKKYRERWVGERSRDVTHDRLSIHV